MSADHSPKHTDRKTTSADWIGVAVLAIIGTLVMLISPAKELAGYGEVIPQVFGWGLIAISIIGAVRNVAHS